MPGHPNIFGDPSKTGSVYICLSMLKPHTASVKYDGWTCAYTCMSLLLQLQSFLFADNIEQDYGEIEGPVRHFADTEWNPRVVKSVRANNSVFWLQIDDGLCHTHSAPWPPFADAETLSTLPVPEAVLRRRAAVTLELELSRELKEVDEFVQAVEALEAKLQDASATLSYKDVVFRSHSRMTLSRKLAGRASLVARHAAAREAAAAAVAELKRDADEATRRREAQSVHLADFAADLVLAIADRLRTEDLPSVCRVCRAWRTVAQESCLFARRQTCCFYTKERFDAPGVCLGVGLRLTLHRSGELKEVATPFDMLSESAFTRDCARLSVWKETFTHFLPLAIDRRHFERGLPYLQHVTKQVFGERAKTTHLLELLAAAMNSMVVQLFGGIVDGAAPPLHASEVALDGYCGFHHLLLCCAERWPDLRTEADQRVRSFIARERARHKEATPDLGRFLVSLTLSSNGWRELRYPFLREFLARCARWVLQKKPFLESATSSLARAHHTFGASLTGLRLVAFQISFLTLVGRPAGSTGPHDVLADYERRLGRPTAAQRSQLQAMAKRLLQLASYAEFFSLVGANVPDATTLNELLVDAIQSSADRSYHRPRPKQGRAFAAAARCLMAGRWPP